MTNYRCQLPDMDDAEGYGPTLEEALAHAARAAGIRDASELTVEADRDGRGWGVVAEGFTVGQIRLTQDEAE